jgi:integrase
MSVRRQRYRCRSTGKIREHWIVDVDVEHPDGRRERVRKVSPRQTKRGAEQFERELRDSILSGVRGREEVKDEKPEQPQPVVPTVREFAKPFLEVYAAVNNKPSEQFMKKSILKHHILPRLGKFRLDAIRPEIEPFKAALLAKGLSRKRLNNILAVLSRMLRFAEEQGVLDRVPKVRFLKVAAGRHDYLNFEEYEQLLNGAAGEPEWRAAFMIAAEAGLRMGEIIALEWKDIDFAAANLRVWRSSWFGVVGTTKGGRARTIPMTRRLAATLEAHRHDRSTLVFCTPDGKPLTPGRMDKPLSRICKSVRLRDMGWHVLRHTYCSHLAMRGAAPAAIQALAGHQSVSTTQRYMHLAPSMLRETVRLLDDRGPQRNEKAQSGTDCTVTAN